MRLIDCTFAPKLCLHTSRCLCCVTSFENVFLWSFVVCSLHYYLESVVLTLLWPVPQGNACVAGPAGRGHVSSCHWLSERPRVGADLFSKSVFFVSIRSNDFIHYYLRNVLGVQTSYLLLEFNRLLVNTTRQEFKVCFLLLQALVCNSVEYC
jgi:hypothetical protein